MGQQQQRNLLPLIYTALLCAIICLDGDAGQDLQVHAGLQLHLHVLQNSEISEVGSFLATLSLCVAGMGIMETRRFIPD
jgi:hypothetical protein